MRRWLAGLALLGLISTAHAETLVMGLAAAPTGLDPHGFIGVGDGTVLTNIYEPLVRLGPDGALRPGLATTWTAVDEHTWEFALRHGVTFHDGTPFTAADVAASYHRATTLKTSLRGLASRLVAITAVEQPDAHTIRLHTAVPAPDLPFEIAAVGILRAADCGLTDAAAFNSGEHAIGTGPFRFAAAPDPGRLELARNAAWWDTAPVWRRVSLRFIPSDTARTAALLAGDVDVMERPAARDVPVLAARPGMALSQAGAQNAVYLLPNFARDSGGEDITGPYGEPLAENPLRDRRVRLALSLAIRREALAEHLLAGAVTPAGQLVPAGTPSHDPSIAVPHADLARSHTLLAEAGYPNGLRLVLRGPTDRVTGSPQVLEAIAQMWSRAGLPTRVETMPYAAYAQRVAHGEFMLALYSCCASMSDGAMIAANLLATYDAASRRGAGNAGRYANPLLDAIVARGLASFDPALRQDAARAALRLVAEEAPLIVLYHPINRWAARAPIDYIPRQDGRSPAIGARLATGRTAHDD